MNFRNRLSLVVALGCAGALAAVAVPALATKGSVKSATVPFPPDTIKSAGASCGAGSHVTGTGYAVNPLAAQPFVGVKTLTTVNNYNGTKATKTTSGSLANSGSTSLTSYARCEKKSDGKIAIYLTGSTTIQPGDSVAEAVSANLNFNCPSQTHPIGGGYEVDHPFDPNDGAQSNKFFAFQNRRISSSVWTISGFLLGGPTALPAKFTGTVACELNGSRKVIQRKSALLNFANDARTTASASCRKGSHLVSGGWYVNDPDPNSIALPFIDKAAPSGRTWTVSAYESLFAPPLGSTMQAYAYCRKNFKKKKRRRVARSGSAASVGTGHVDVTRQTFAVAG